MEPIIEIDGVLVNLRNVDFIDFNTKKIYFNHEWQGTWTKIDCSNVVNFKSKVQEQIDKLNTKEFN